MPLETMLRIYFLQKWYALSDPMAEETLYDSEAKRQFAGIKPCDDRILDETTILNFCHLLEKQQLSDRTRSLCEEILSIGAAVAFGWLRV